MDASVGRIVVVERGIVVLGAILIAQVREAVNEMKSVKAPGWMDFHWSV